jgi:hypothetical protein
VLFTYDGTQLLAVAVNPTAAASGAWVATPLAGGPNAAPVNLAQGVSSALDGTSPLPTLFVAASALNGAVWAMDAGLAAGGTARYLWQQATFPYYDTRTGVTWSCTGLPGNGLLVGSDGTVYQPCREGVVQALHPDGGSPGSATTAQGVLRWLSFPAASWGVSAFGPHPAVAAVPGGPDVIYYGKPGTAPRTLSVIRPTLAGTGVTRTEVQALGDIAIVADADGTALALGGTAFSGYELAAISPTGELRYRSPSPYGFGNYAWGTPWALTRDGLLWLVDSTGATPWLTALQVTNPALPTKAFQLHGYGNASFDVASWLNFVPQVLAPETGTAMLLTDFSSTGGVSGPRRMIGIAAPGTPGVSQWGTSCGDAQHRCSLKTR